MKTKSLIASLTTALALTAGLSSPAFAEFKHRYHYTDEPETTQPARRAEPSKAVPAEPRRVIRRDELYLNTP